MNQKATGIFDKAHSNMIESTFSLPAFVLACKKSGYIFYGPMTRLATPIFDHVHPVNFSSAFNCYESA